MKAAVLHSFTDIRIEDIPVPGIGPGEALVKMRACGICSGDVMPWYIEKKAPLVLGHEPAGEIVQVGEGVTAFAPGDRVFMHHHAPCMICARCRKGDYVQCDTWRRTKIVPGGLAEYVRVPAENLMNDTLKLPDNVSFEGGTLVEPLACVVKGMRRMGTAKSETALVIGLGVMGMLFISLLKHEGMRVIAADMVRYRLDKAREFGADEMIDVSPPHPASPAGGEERLKQKVMELTGGEGAYRVVIGPSSIRAMEQGIPCAAPGGTVLFFTPAPPGELLTFDQNAIYFKDVNFVQSYSCGPDDTREALSLIERGIIPVDKVITHRFPLEQAEEAFRLTSKAGESLKAIVVIN
jgi:L-iditol 2-dehydrogenase